MFESVRIGTSERAEAILIPVFAGETLNGDSSQWSAKPEVRAAIGRKEFTGEPENLVETFVAEGEQQVRVLLVGLGKREALNREKLRRAAAAAGRRLAKTRESVVAVEGVEAAAVSLDEIHSLGRCFGESLGLLAWQGRLYQGKGSSANPPGSLTLVSSTPAFLEGLHAGLGLARSANLARTLSQTPPNIATPLWMAEQARALARETGLDCRVLEGEELEHERLAGLLNVGRASVNPPCLIRLAYNPAGGSTAQPVVLIGKTITYDTGGLTLKVNNGMVGMKRDKDGGCAVLGAVHAVATLLKPDFPVIGLLAAAENSVSESAYRPDDVLTYRNGVTVEVTNTDAEGRLVLADALAWACEIENPASIVDLATLTGGVVTALGSTFAGYFCDDAPLGQRLEQAADASGERLWRLPLHEEYREMLKSPVADIINSNPNRKAHPIQGAAFLSYFVRPGVPWAHVDIAGVHSVDADAGPFIKGPTGFGVRLLADLIAGLSATAPGI